MDMESHLQNIRVSWDVPGEGQEFYSPKFLNESYVVDPDLSVPGYYMARNVKKPQVIKILIVGVDEILIKTEEKS